LIALALLPESRLLLMDEPLNGLDPDSVIIIRDLLEAFKTIDQIVIVSSHNLDELDKVTDRLIFKVDHGLSLETVAEGAEARYAELYRRPRKKLVHHA
ncbi:MAG TPA: ABC transporter ATP-binding protein, partial [Lactobacillus sp.]|nr:ABC transporter ATP-binding protein [Lactobacillus sp.]